MDQIYNLSDEERVNRMEALIDKLMNSGLENTKRNTKWKNRDFVQDVIRQYLHYLLVDRNEMLSELGEQGTITEDDAFSHLEKTYSFRSKPNLQKTKQIMAKLDEFFKCHDSNHILMKHGKICDDSLDKLSEKLQIIAKYHCEGTIVNSPQKLRASAEWIRARLGYYSDMIALGKEKRSLADIPASELFSDKDRFTQGNGKQMSSERKQEIIKKYGVEQGE